MYLLLPPVTSLGCSRGEGELYSWSYSRLVNRISGGRSNNSNDNSQVHQSVRNSSLKTRLVLMLYLVFPSQLLNPSCRSLVSEVLVLWREHRFLLRLGYEVSSRGSLQVWQWFLHLHTVLNLGAEPCPGLFLSVRYFSRTLYAHLPPIPTGSCSSFCTFDTVVLFRVITSIWLKGLVNGIRKVQ